MEQELNTLREKFVQDLFVSQGLGAVIDEALVIVSQYSVRVNG